MNQVWYRTPVAPIIRLMDVFEESAREHRSVYERVVRLCEANVLPGCRGDHPRWNAVKRAAAHLAEPTVHPERASHEWAGLYSLPEILNGTAPALPPASAERWQVGLEEAATFAAPLLFAHVNDSARHLLDAGGGHGAYAATFLDVNPTAEATVVDIDSVLPSSVRRRPGVHYLAADIVSFERFVPADLVLHCNVAHWLSRTELVSSLATLRHHVLPGARLVLKDLDPETWTGAAFGLALAVHTGSPQLWTAAELAEAIQAAGWGELTRVRPPRLQSSVIWLATSE